MISEAFAIFFFTFAILRVCCDHDKPPQATDGIVIGIALLTAIVGTATMSGGGVNPAIATGLRIVNYALDDEYGYASSAKGHGEESFFCGRFSLRHRISNVDHFWRIHFLTLR